VRRDRARRSARSRQRADGGCQSLPATERLLFFGERAAALKWAADGLVTLLQMMVLPYITVSIVGSLGALRPSELRTLRLPRSSARASSSADPTSIRNVLHWTE